MKKLDKIDYQILDILQKNSRVTNQDLAKMVSLAPSSCLQRVRRLQSADLISSYHAKLNLSEICEFVTCIVNVKLKSHSHEELQAFTDAVTSIPEVVECFTVNGECDYILKVIARNMTAYLDINDKLVSSSLYVATTTTHVVFDENKAFSHVDLTTLC